MFRQAFSGTLSNLSVAYVVIAPTGILQGLRRQFGEDDAATFDDNTEETGSCSIHLSVVPFMLLIYLKLARGEISIKSCGNALKNMVPIPRWGQ